MDIIICIPKTTNWEVYQKEIDMVEDGSMVMNFKVPFFPKKAFIDDYCFLCYDGEILGAMKIVGFSEESFICQTTGNELIGKFIQRSGKLHGMLHLIEMAGFRGFRYAEPSLRENLDI